MSDMQEIMQEASQVLSQELLDGMIKSISNNPKLMADMFWRMDSEQMAEFFEELFKMTDGSHLLMMQMLYARDDCEKRSPESLECFQTMFASAFKYMSQ